jgi:hypothetical protein
MQRMVQEPNRKGGGAGEKRSSVGWRSYGVRLCLGVASVVAAYLLITGAWPAEFASEALASAEAGTVPAAFGPAFDIAGHFR